MALADLGGANRVLSRPVKLHWAGWETDTYRLQQAGWQLSAEQDISRQTMRLAIRHPEGHLQGLTEISEFDYWKAAQQEAPWVGARSLCMRSMGYKIVVHDHGPFDFSPIDAQPQWGNSVATFAGDPVTDLSGLAHFATPLIRTQAIVLPEEDVDALLARILEKQQPAKTAHFRDLARRQQGEPMQAHRFHAQIVSLRDAA